MKTYSTRASEIRRTWHVLDATDVPLGRLASQVASLIRGKHKVTYAPHLDTGDYVVVVNAARVGVTGRKLEQKQYYRHSQYPGGLKIRTLREQADRNPARVIEHAVFGMLPHNRLGRALHGHLKVYAGSEHPHTAQVGGPPQPALSQPPKNGGRRARRAAARLRSTAAAPVAAVAPAQDAVGAVPAVTPADAEVAAETVAAAPGTGVPTEQAQAAETLDEAVPTAAPPTEPTKTSEEDKA